MSPVSQAAEIKPWIVGETGVVVVGFEGRIDAVTTETITICGHTVPRRLDHEGGVRYLSMLWPDEPRVVEINCQECDAVKDEAERDALRIHDLIHEEHEDHHPEPWAICRNTLCRAVRNA